MTEEQIRELDDFELEMHVRRVQQIDSADRELAELLNERRRRQIYAAACELSEDGER